MSERKFATILGVYGGPADRFMGCGYKTDVPSVYQRIEIAGKQELVKGVEIIYGQGDDFHDDTQADVFKAIDDHGLVVCGVNPNLWGEKQWGRGTLGSTDAKIRRMAIDRVKRAMDMALLAKSDFVGIWPGQDGYDYVFEVDYQQQYDWWISGIQECADYNPEIKIGLEYKPYEPRTHSTIDTAPKTLLMLNDIDRPNTGMVLDVGHSLVAHENISEVITFAQRKKKLLHMHLNDNYTDWDWDMNFASVRIFEFIEMIYWLKRTGFTGWYSVDIFAYRTNAADSVEESLTWLNTLMDFVDSTGQETFQALISQADPIATSRFFRRALFG
jgi:sugar phosphate isomerase/epimerase